MNTQNLNTQTNSAQTIPQQTLGTLLVTSAGVLCYFLGNAVATLLSQSNGIV